MPNREIRTTPLARLAAAVPMLGILALASPTWTPADEPAAPHRLSIERLYTLPDLIGTAPSGFAWSQDGSRLAFLWNDEGYTFRDVWVLDATSAAPKPRRVTRLAPAPPDPEDATDPLAAAEALEAFERNRGVASVVWGPEDQHLLFSLGGDLWTVTTDPTAGEAPVRLTETPAPEIGAAYSPTGDVLAFLREGDLWWMDAAGRETRATEIADYAGTPDLGISSFRWSPDGRFVAFLESDRREVPLRAIPDYLTEEPRLRELRRAYPGEPAPIPTLHLLDRSSAGTVTRLSLPAATDTGGSDNGGSDTGGSDTGAPGRAPDMILSYRWAPDSRSIAVDTSDLYAKDRRILLVDVATSETTEIARDRDPANETFYFWRIAWSRDGSRLFFLSDREDDYHVWSVSPDSPGTAARLTREAGAVSELHPVPGGLVLVTNWGRPEERQLYHLSDEGGEPVRFSTRPGTHAPTLSPDGLWAADRFSSDDTPPDLWLTEVQPPDGASEATERRITDSPLAEFDTYRWVTPRYVSFESHVDQTTLHGRLTLPPDFDPSKVYPAILGSVYTDSVRNQWGGRTAHPTWGLDQFLAQQGYVLLNVDMRGSWGRGREHRRGIRLDYGGMDIEDLESGARYLAELGYVDPERIGIWGSSYGGLMTAMSLFRKPGLFAAGIAGAPATNVWHALTGQMAVMMRPQDQPDEYADSSPFMHAEGLEEPLMIIHGMRDWVVLYKDSVTLVQRLILLGKEDVELVTLPDGGHGWDNEGLAQTRFAFLKMVDFFARHLGGPVSEGTASPTAPEPTTGGIH